MKDSNGIEIKPGGELSYTIEYRYPSDQFPGSFERRKEIYRYPVIEFKNVLCLENERGAKMPISYFKKCKLEYHESKSDSKSD